MFRNSEFFLNNYLSVEFKKMLEPLHIMQYLYILPKFQIKGNFLSHNTWLLKIISATVYFFVTVVDIFRAILSFTNSAYAFASVSRYVFAFQAVYYVFGFVFNYKINVYYSEDNIKFLVDLQRSTNTNLNKRRILKYITLYNWIAVILKIFTHILVNLLVFWAHKDLMLFVGVFFFESFDINVIYATQMIVLIRLNMESLLTQMNTSGCSMKGRWKKCRNMHWEQLFQKYVKLLEVFEFNRTTYEGLILFHNAEAFLHTLLYAHIAIGFYKVSHNNKGSVTFLNILPIINTIVWFLKNMGILIYMSMECEKMYLTLQDAESCCDRSSVSGRKLYKNIERVNRIQFQKFSAYGLFFIDGTLPRRLCYYVSAYTVVILQFYFL